MLSKKEIRVSWRYLPTFQKYVKKHYKGKVDFIIGILRGGGALAIAASNILDLPVFFIHTKRYNGRSAGAWICESYGEVTAEMIKDKRILIIDDLIDEGVTMENVKSYVLQWQPSEVRCLVMLTKDVEFCKRLNVDYLRTVAKGTWIILPWEE